ncbi:MAG: hypothetical protein E7328_04895 [Clostridiales bacterium]|nr:hypothetical protein [Clostridiales bacterium]
MITLQTFIRGGTISLKSIIKMVKYLIPSIFLIRLLVNLGAMDAIASFMAPVMGLFGMPGEAALALLMGQVGLAAGLGAAVGMGLTAKQLTVLAVFYSFCHSLVIETGVLGGTGCKPWFVAIVRVTTAVIMSMVTNLIL